MPVGVYGRWKKRTKAGWDLSEAVEQAQAVKASSIPFILCVTFPAPIARNPVTYSFLFPMNIKLLSDFSLVLHRKLLMHFKVLPFLEGAVLKQKSKL